MTELISLTGCSRRQIRRWRERGLLPPPVGGRRTAQWSHEALLRIRRIKEDVLDSRVTLDEFAERLRYESPPRDG